MKYIVILLVGAFIFGCTKSNQSAVESLRTYVKKIANNKYSQEDYKEIATGKLLRNIEAMSNEEFESYTRTSAIKNTRTQILNENCTGNKCTITYTVKYNSKTSDGAEYITEVRKLAQLEKEEDIWKLADVENIKTYHESANALNPLEE